MYVRGERVRLQATQEMNNVPLGASTKRWALSNLCTRLTTGLHGPTPVVGTCFGTPQRPTPREKKKKHTHAPQYLWFWLPTQRSKSAVSANLTRMSFLAGTLDMHWS